MLIFKIIVIALSSMKCCVESVFCKHSQSKVMLHAQLVSEHTHTSLFLCSLRKKKWNN